MKQHEMETIPNLNVPNDRDLYESQIATEERERTTFTQDFLIAERYGIAAIRDTYNRAFGGWKNFHKYLTELCMTLNHLLAMHYYHDGEDDERTKLYNDLWQQTYEWGKANLKGEELNFFYSVLD